MRAVLIVPFLLAAAPAAAEVVLIRADGFVSRNVAEVSATPADAWREFVAPAGWWNPAHTFSGDAANLYIDAGATGCFCEKLPLPKDAPAGQRPGSVEHLHVVYVDTGRVMRLQGGLGPLQSEAINGTLTVTLKPQNGKTRILMEYVVGGFMRQEMDKLAPLVDKVMAEQLARLALKIDPASVTTDRPAEEAETVQPEATAKAN